MQCLVCKREYPELKKYVCENCIARETNIARNGTSMQKCDLALSLKLNGDKRQSAQWYISALESDYIPALKAMMDMISMYEGEYIKEWSEIEAEKGNKYAQCALAMQYMTGHYQQKNHYLGARLFKSAAEQGLSIAQRELAYLYQSGYGVEVNESISAYWYKLAAEQGDQAAELNYGNMLFTGRGVKKDLELAKKYWIKAATNPDPSRNFADTAKANLFGMFNITVC